MVRGALRNRKIWAWIHGAWAVHAQFAQPDLYCITHSMLGLTLPLEWASFLSEGQAMEAAMDVQRVRDDWLRITQRDLSPDLAERLHDICQRHGGLREMVQQLTDDADAARLGLTGILRSPVWRPRLPDGKADGKIVRSGLARLDHG